VEVQGLAVASVYHMTEDTVSISLKVEAVKPKSVGGQPEAKMELFVTPTKTTKSRTIDIQPKSPLFFTVALPEGLDAEPSRLRLLHIKNGEVFEQLDFVPGKTAKLILVSCGARLAVFDIQELRDLTAYDELGLDKLGDRKLPCFLS